MKVHLANNNAWSDGNEYIMGTASEVHTNALFDIYPNDTTITAEIKGNTVQSGTPSPSQPCDVVECGERTENLTTLTEVTHDSYIKILTPANSHLFDNIEYDTEYTLSWEITSTSTSSVYNQIRFLRSNSTSVKEISNGDSFTLTSTEMSEIVSIAFYFGRNNTNGRMYNFMLNAGSTALPYQPYGFKIPISMGGTTNNVYLGEVQTVRQIQKLVLTGQETWEVFLVGTGRYFRYMISSTATAIINVGICSHYKQGNIAPATINTDIFNINAPSSGGNGVVISPSDVTLDTASDFKAYLAQQYSNNTPVTIWYVLANPTTGITNEPLMKIGDYADAISSISLTTTPGEKSFSVETAVKPSEITLNFKGWHPKNPKERTGGEWG